MFPPIPTNYHVSKKDLVMAIDQVQEWRENRKGGQNGHLCQFILAQYLDQKPLILH